MPLQKEFKGDYRKQVEIYYRKPIRKASSTGGVRVIIGVKGTLASESQNFIKVRDISDIVRDEQPDWAAQEHEQLQPAYVKISKKNIATFYVRE
ncbi:MAG: hypothetical protein QXM31_02265 [Candidatus Woesearchaeota archaeon]